MVVELSQHLNRLLHSYASQSLSVSGDHHNAHDKASLAEGTINDSTEFSTIGGEEDDGVLEMGNPINCLSFAFHIVSDNPRSHTTAPVVSRSKPRLVQSTSTPGLRGHRSFGSKNDSGRRRGADAYSKNARWSPMIIEKKTSSEGTRSGGLKVPSRSKLDKPTTNNAGWEDQGSRNASWDQPASKLQGLGSNKACLRNLVLSGLIPKTEEDKYGASAVRNQLSPSCRWSIPRRSSDSMLSYPKRQRATSGECLSGQCPFV
jgi:hypothetical protein